MTTNEISNPHEKMAEINQAFKNDLDRISKKLEEYKTKWEAYQAEIDKQVSERKARENKQWGWGQSVNLVPLFSHVYDLATSKANEGIESKESEIRELLLKAVEEKYQELQQELQNQSQEYQSQIQIPSKSN